MAKARRVMYQLVILSVIIALGGCARVKEATKCFMGTSTRCLEKGRKNAIVKTFNYDYFTTYTKALDTLKQAGSYIYAQDIKKRMIAFYVSSEDTTPVGIFFSEIDANNTKIEISSPSTSAKEEMSKKVFFGLEANDAQK